MTKKFLAVFIPTELSLLHYSHGKIISSTEKTGKNELYKSIPVNLHIISNEELKGGDWHIHIQKNSPEAHLFCTLHKFVDLKGFGIDYSRETFKKIIATTDESLKLPLIIDNGFSEINFAINRLFIVSLKIEEENYILDFLEECPTLSSLEDINETLHNFESIIQNNN